MISVLIPLYNKERFIRSTIVSVLNQTFQDFELIIINDGSTDNSLEAVEEFDDKRIKIHTIENSGVSIARNFGVQNAKYHYVAFLDADDYWDKTFLNEIKKLITQYPAEKVFASGRISIFSDHKIEYSNPFLPKKNEVDKIDYLKVISRFLPPVNSSNSVFKKLTLLEAGLFREGQKQHEDHDLWLRVCKGNEVVYINKPLSFYRKSILNSGSQSKIRFFDFYNYLETILKVKNSIDKPRRLFFKTYYDKFILLTFIKNQSGFSKEEIQKFFKLNRKIVSPHYLVLIYLVNLLPSGILYKFLKRVRR
jgi:glycosyltransferase involved in cell wall biosynthesis